MSESKPNLVRTESAIAAHILTILQKAQVKPDVDSCKFISQDLSENPEETKFFVRLVSPVDPADMGQGLKKVKEELRDRGVATIEEFVTASCAAPAASSGGKTGQQVLLNALNRRGVQVSGESEHKVIEFTPLRGGRSVNEAQIPEFVTAKLLEIAQAFDGDQGLALDMYRMIDGQNGENVYYTDSHEEKHAVGFFINSELMHFFRGSLTAIDGSVKFSVVDEKTLIRRKKGENDALLIEFLNKFKHESDGSTAECSVIVEAKRVKNAAGMYVGIEISIAGVNLDAALTQSGHADGMKKGFFTAADDAKTRDIFADYRPIVQNQVFITLQKDRLAIARGRDNPETYDIPGPNYKIIGDALSKLVDILPKLSQEDVKGLISALSKCDARTAGVVTDILVTLSNACKEDQFKLLCGRFINELNKSERLEGGYSAIEGVLEPELQKVPTIINDPKVSQAFLRTRSVENTEILLFLSRFGENAITIMDGVLAPAIPQQQNDFVASFLKCNSKVRKEIVSVLFSSVQAKGNTIAIFDSLNMILQRANGSEQNLAGILSKNLHAVQTLLKEKLAYMNHDKSTAKKCMKLLFGKSSSISLPEQAQFVSVMLQSDEGTANLAMKFAVKYQESFIRFFNALGDRGVVSFNLLNAYTKLLEAKSAKQAKQILASWARLVEKFGSLNVNVNGQTLLELALKYRNPDEMVEVITKTNQLYLQLGATKKIPSAFLIEQLGKMDAARLQSIMGILDKVLKDVKHVDNPDDTVDKFLGYILNLREDQKSVSAVVTRVINFDQFNEKMFTDLQKCHAKRVMNAVASSEGKGWANRLASFFRLKSGKDILGGDFVGKAVSYYAKQVEAALKQSFEVKIGSPNPAKITVPDATVRNVSIYMQSLSRENALVFKKLLMQVLNNPDIKVASKTLFEKTIDFSKTNFDLQQSKKDEADRQVFVPPSEGNDALRTMLINLVLQESQKSGGKPANLADMINSLLSVKMVQDMVSSCSPCISEQTIKKVLQYRFAHRDSIEILRTFDQAIASILDTQKQIDTRVSCIEALNNFCAREPMPSAVDVAAFVDKVADVCKLAHEKIPPANMADVITNMGKSDENDRQSAIGVIVSIGGNSNEDKAARGIFVRQTAAKDSLPVGVTYESLAMGFKNTFTALRDSMSLNELARIFSEFSRDRIDDAAKLFDGGQEHNKTILSLKNVSDIELISQVQNIVRVHGESSTQLTLEATGQPNPEQPAVGPSNAAGAVATGIMSIENKDDVVKQEDRILRPQIL